MSSHSLPPRPVRPLQEGTRPRDADAAGPILATRDRELIQRWASAHDARPATGVGKVDVNDGGCPVRLMFPGQTELKPISWDEWFQVFDGGNFTFVYEDDTGESPKRNHFRIVRSEDVGRHLR